MHFLSTPIEGQLVYRLWCLVGQQSSATIGKQGSLLINPTLAPHLSASAAVLLLDGAKNIKEQG